MKRLLLFLLMAVSITSQAQNGIFNTVQVKNSVRLYDWTVTRFQRDSNFTSDNSVPTSKAVYDFVVGRVSNISGGATYTNGWGIQSIVGNVIKADSTWNGMQTKIDNTRRLDSLKNVIGLQQATSVSNLTTNTIISTSNGGFSSQVAGQTQAQLSFTTDGVNYGGVVVLRSLGAGTSSSILEPLPNITTTRNWNLPDASGTIALTTDISSYAASNVILKQTTPQTADFYVTNTGRVDEFMGIGTGRLTTEKLRVLGNSRLEGYTDIVNGNLTVYNPNASGGAQIHVDNDQGQNGIFASVPGGMIIGTQSSHPVHFMAGFTNLITLSPTTNTISFDRLSGVYGPPPVAINYPVRPLGIDNSGIVRNDYDFWPQYRDSILKLKGGFELDQMMYAAYDPLDSTKLDTLGVYFVRENPYGGIIDSAEYAKLLAAATDSLVMHLTGEETIRDLKIFSDSIGIGPNTGLLGYKLEVNGESGTGIAGFYSAGAYSSIVLTSEKVGGTGEASYQLGKNGVVKWGLSIDPSRNGTADFAIHDISTGVNALRINTSDQVLIAKLATGLTAPTTSGTTKMVITDANGLLSFADIPGGGSSYIFTSGITEISGTVTNDLITGKSGGQTITGGTAASENLTLTSTSHATKGKILFGSASGYDAVNIRFGINTQSPSSKLHLISTGINVTQNDAYGILLDNTDAATNNNQKMSPGFVFSGQGWKTATTASSQNVRWRIDMLPVQGSANPGSVLQFASSINGGAYGNVMTMTDAGVMTVSGSILSTSAIALNGQLTAGTTSTFLTYRFTNGGSNQTPYFFVGDNATTTAGTPAVAMEGKDKTNGLLFLAANGTRQIARASINIGSLTNTAGSESGDMIFSTQTGGGSLAERFRIAANGASTFQSSVTASSFVKSGATSTDALMGNGTVQTVTSGIYTPTISSTSNITGTTVYDATYLRVGNTVTVSGKIDINVTASGATSFRMTVPVSTTFSALGQGEGTVATANSSDVGVVSETAASTTTMLVSFSAGASGTKSYSYHFTYKVQ